MGPIDVEKLFKMDAHSVGTWTGAATFLGALSFLGHRRKAWRTRRRLLQIELRLEAAWENTKAVLHLSGANRLAAQSSILADLRSGPANDPVLSNRSVARNAQTAQQSEISCDI